MTRVCLIGADGVDLPADLLAYGTAREALASYALEAPYADAVCVETISLGAAVSLLNDLEWYLRRLVDEAIVLEPSVDGDEWLSRELATAIRNERVDPAETGTFLKVYGVVEADGDEGNGGGGGPPPDAKPRLAEPMFAQRVAGEVPGYDLREVDDTLVVRVTEGEFGAV